MDLTPDNKAHIDAMSLEGLLERWRNAPCGDPWFQGETGKYWGKRMNELRAKPDGGKEWTAASKRIGWDGPDSS